MSAIVDGVEECYHEPYKGPPVGELTQEITPLHEGEIFSDVVGSPYYVAPEVLKKSYGPEANVWSVGVIIYILLSGVPLFWAENEQGIFEEVLNGKLDFESEPWPGISASDKDLVRRMLVRDPKKRLTAHEVLYHVCPGESEGSSIGLKGGAPVISNVGCSSVGWQLVQTWVVVSVVDM